MELTINQQPPVVEAVETWAFLIMRCLYLLLRLVLLIILKTLIDNVSPDIEFFPSLSPTNGTRRIDDDTESVRSELSRASALKKLRK